MKKSFFVWLISCACFVGSGACFVAAGIMAHSDPVGSIDSVDGKGHMLPVDQFARPDADNSFGLPHATHGFQFSIPNPSPNNANRTHIVYAYGAGLNGTYSRTSAVNSQPPSTSSLAGTEALLPAVGKFWFAPNQGAANVWYQPPPGSGVINGHIERSFKYFEYWPKLRATLLRNMSGFAVGTSELGFMNRATLQQFRDATIPVSTESPSFTQCADGRDLASLDFDGVSPPSPPDFFCSIFAICSGTPSTDNRNDPHGTGWFRTLDDQAYTPEELVLDERMPNLLPSYDYATITNGSITDWAQRKAMALRDNCTYANTFNPYADRITGLIHDYVEYAVAMKAHFAPNLPPRLSLHWNVHPAWEWSNPAWLDQLHSRLPTRLALRTHT